MEQISGKGEFKAYFRLIGKVKTQIEKAATWEEALQLGLKCIAEETKADSAVLWYAAEDQKTLHPYYWISSYDYTQCVRKAGADAAGRAYAESREIALLDYHVGDDPVTDQDMKDIHVSSLICVPFTSEEKTVGCIQLVKGNGGHFESEIVDICQIMEMILSMTIEENQLYPDSWHFDKRLIHITGLEKSFRNGEEITKVLKGISLDVFEGEFLVLLGESGCGKSTLLNIIGGMNQADQGTYFYEDRDLSHVSKSELTDFRRENVGFIFQNYHLMPNLTAKENIDFIGELVKDPLDSTELLEAVRLSDKRSHYPSQLSGGQQQRVSIARALVKRPKLILADEPTAALDYATSIEVLDLLSRVVKRKATLIMVTHNEEITRMADRVVRIRDGRVYEISVNRHPVQATDLVW